MTGRQHTYIARLAREICPTSWATDYSWAHAAGAVLDRSPSNVTRKGLSNDEASRVINALLECPKGIDHVGQAKTILAGV